MRRCGLACRSVPPLLSATLIGALAGCAESGAGVARVERVDSAGITIVRNAGPDRPLSWTFSPIRSLGGAEEGPESFYQLSPGKVDTDSAGNLYVLDSPAHRVVVFGPDGTHLRTLGRQGGGPDEIEFAGALEVASDGTVSVYDISKRRLVRWGPGGEVQASRPVSVLISGRFARMGDALVAVVPGRSLSAERIRERLLVMRPADTTEPAVLEVPNPGMIDFGCVAMSLPPLFHPSLIWGAWSVQGERIAVAPGVGYVVNVHGPSRILSFRRDLEPRPATREMALAEVGEERTVTFGSGRPPCRIPGAEIVNKRGFAPVLPAVGAIALSPDGRIWVRRGAVEGEEVIIDIFAADGAYLGTLPPGSPFPVAFTPSGAVVALEKDEYDLDYVIVHRVNRARD